MTTDRIKILKDAIKWKDAQGKVQRVKVGYSKGDYTNLPKGTVTIYAQHYKDLPKELNPINDSDYQSDYVQEDYARITPNSKYYSAVLKAMKQKEESRKNREKKRELMISKGDDVLMAKIKQLAKVSTDNSLLDYTEGGYMKTPNENDAIWGKSAKHIIRAKKKYAYIDRDTSGKFMVATEGNLKGNVFGIKGYGQRGHYMGDIDKVIRDVERNNKQLISRIVDKIGVPARKK